MLADVRRVASFSAGIRRYLRADLSDEALAARLRRDLATREQRLLATLDAGIYARPTSPYLALLRHAGIEREDLAALVRDEGMEGALHRVHDAGVHVTAEELKGRAPIVRGSLTLHVRAEDFDNPFGPGGLSSISGGTSGTPLRLGLSINDLEEDIAYVRPWLAGAGAAREPSRPLAWRAAEPLGPPERVSLAPLRARAPFVVEPDAGGVPREPARPLALSVALRRRPRARGEDPARRGTCR